MKAFAERLNAQMKGWVLLTGAPDNVNQLKKICPPVGG